MIKMEIDTLADAIAERLRVPQQDRLIGLDGLCELLDVKSKTTARKIADRPDFPKRIKLSPSMPRWVYGEITQWKKIQIKDSNLKVFCKGLAKAKNLPPMSWLDRYDLENAPTHWADWLEPGIYFLFHRKKIVYVGQTKNLINRLKAHSKTEKVFDAFSYITAFTLEERLRIEAYYIDKYRPEYNVAGIYGR